MANQVSLILITVVIIVAIRCHWSVRVWVVRSIIALSGHRKVLCGVYDYVEFHIKSKAAVEGTVYYSTIAIVGKLRNRKFFSFDELNSAIRKELEKLNSTPFQKREGVKKIGLSGRRTAFHAKTSIDPF